VSGQPDGAVERAHALVQLFHAPPERFGRFSNVAPDAMPPGPRTLLDHSSHMTLAMERFHGGPVRLVVLARRECDDGRYAREILLTDPAGRVVQAGIVRIDLTRFSEANAAAIRSESTPLGRILLAAGLHCDVHDVKLLQLDPGPEFAAVVGSASTTTSAFGRVASIGLDGVTIIELLEIVAPGTA
jgi:hypothetical protein